jgi:hypothetical protein
MKWFIKETWYFTFICPLGAFAFCWIVILTNKSELYPPPIHFYWACLSAFGLWWIMCILAFIKMKRERK